MSGMTQNNKGVDTFPLGPFSGLEKNCRSTVAGGWPSSENINYRINSFISALWSAVEKSKQANFSCV